jgi:hypothetical protein
MNYFNTNVEETKLILKKLQEDKKQVLKGKGRTYLVTPLVNVETIVDFSLKQYQNFHERVSVERKRSNDALNDRVSLEKTGIFDNENFKKPAKKLETEEKIKIWTENAYPKINEKVWDIEFEEKELINYLKELK